MNMESIETLLHIQVNPVFIERNSIVDFVEVYGHPILHHPRRSSPLVRVVAIVHVTDASPSASFSSHCCYVLYIIFSPAKNKISSILK